MADGGHVTVVEVAARDGLQNEPRTLPTETKVRLIEMLAGAGLPVVEATSFVSPRAVPQLADAEQVLAALHRRPGVRYPVLVPNARGLERAQAAGAREIAVFAAASEAFSEANIGMTVEQSMREFKPLVAAALDAGMWVRGYVSTVFGCPYQGVVKPSEVGRVAARLADMGCQEISLGDTNGVGVPEQVPVVLQAVTTSIAVQRIALHLHDTGGLAIRNAAAGLELGVRTFDSSAAGLGGCPFAPGAPGNLATETLLEFLHGQGLETGVDVEAVRAAGEFARAALAA
jgi:hydroxymethylglutaryl-CoA lyase